ncbi:MAG: SCP2 sterol-binding domain-containing protein [Acidobacteria bacterium]|nr:SCP2 sterol-binding domain-containing protein [Acidobacteriota bacterium]
MTEETRDLSVDELTAGMRERLGENSGLDATIKFAFDDGRVIFIDGKSEPNSVTNEDNPADVTLKMSLETLNKLRRKEINSMMAVMVGQIKVEGNIMAAMKLDQILG